MATKRATTPAKEAVEPKARPVRVDLMPNVHKALRKEAADKEVSMAALAQDHFRASRF